MYVVEIHLNITHVVYNKMPYKKRYGKRKYRRKRKRQSFGKKLLQDARKRGVNSSAELAVKIIAKKEAQKLIAPNLIFRRMVFGTFNRTLNTFTNATVVDMNGLIVHIPQVPLWDIQTSNATIPVADPNMVPQIPNYFRGPNLLAAGIVQDGFRNSSKISIQNLGCDLRVHLNPLQAGPSVPRREDITLRYAIVSVTHPDAYLLQWKPDIDEVMAYKGLGYSSRLDVEIRDAPQELKFHTLKSGKLTLKHSQFTAKEKFVSLFWSGSRTYEYQSYIDGVSQASQNGQRVVGTSKIFLCLRSDSPVTDPPDMKVSVVGFMKCGYRNIA